MYLREFQAVISGGAAANSSSGISERGLLVFTLFHALNRVSENKTAQYQGRYFCAKRGMFSY
jgi:hypothetical protein